VAEAWGSVILGNGDAVWVTLCKAGAELHPLAKKNKQTQIKQCGWIFTMSILPWLMGLSVKQKSHSPPMPQQTVGDGLLFAQPHQTTIPL
jgi:hypothetical protein